MRGVEISRVLSRCLQHGGGGGGAVARKVRVTSSEVPCVVLRSRGVCHDVCHTVGEVVEVG